MLKKFNALLVTLFLIILSTTSVFGDTQKLFDSQYGLSNSLINGICQDQTGFLWIATEDGLNRFDGNTFKNYSRSEEKYQLDANFITSILTNKSGELWIGTINTIQRYNPQGNYFETLLFDHKLNLSTAPYISDIKQSTDGTIWIASSSYGLLQYDNKTERIKLLDNINNKIKTKNIKTLFVDNDDNIWIGTVERGIYCYNPKTLELTSIPSLINFDISSIAELNDAVYCTSLSGGVFKINKATKEASPIKQGNKVACKTVFVDSRNRIWVGTDGNGLFVVDEKELRLDKLNYQSVNFDFNKSKIHYILEDRAGNIWLGIFQKGLFLLDESTSIITNYGFNSTNPDLNIGSSCVTAIAETDSLVCFGTDGDGLYLIDKINNKKQHISLEKIGGNNILSLYADNNQLWIGSYLDGLIKFDINNGTAIKYNGNDFTVEKITSIKKLGNSLLLGTLGNRVCKFNISSQEFSQNLLPSQEANDKIPLYINDILVDSNGLIWLASYDGLFAISPQNEEITSYTENNSLLPSNLVYTIHEAPDGNIWAGTYLGITNISTKKNYNTEHGLGSHVICSISSDPQNTLWASTHNGVSYLPQNETQFSSFFQKDGLQANEFYKNAILCAADSSIYFGSINGVSQISSAYLEYQPQINKVILTNIKLLNNTISDENNQKSIVFADTIRFKEAHSTFSINFASDAIANQEKISYQYKLDGFDSDWIRHSNNANTATYTNLNHGLYTFRVKAYYKDYESAERNLTVIILPPWYKTIPAKILWLLISIGIILALFYSQKERVMRQEVERSNERKMQFFINVAHEIKTPLSLILDPLFKLIQQQKNSNHTRLYQTMHSNAHRILRLTNQILDIRKLEIGQLKLQYHECNIYELLTELSASYATTLQTKDINFTIHCNNKEIKAWIDVENFEKVIFNVLSNAVKHTPEKGNIDITIYSDKKLHIDIFNSGDCIPENELEKIFNRFYQTDSSQKISGTGIGLDLARSLINMHQGSIKAKNAENHSGVTFAIDLPLGNTHFGKESIATKPMKLPIQKLPFGENTSKQNNDKNKVNKQNSIMVIDDDKEITNYLKFELQREYQVFSHSDPIEALDDLYQAKPSLVICDAMMPKLNGFELCSRLKKDIKTSHIPVILLSASDHEEYREKGILHGADLYLTKPFNSDTLKKSIENLLENRRRVYQNALTHSAGQVDYSILNLNSQDDLLLQKIDNYINENLSDSNLNVDTIAHEMGMSRVHLYRKLKEITNLSASDYVKNIRMKYAAEILRSKKIPISEIAYKLGYSSPSYFSKSFKTFYGISPKEFIQNSHKNELKN
ncbi:MAG: two-component regulator propeller domain-containing protein [Mangrovibacterium sp.]